MCQHEKGFTKNQHNNNVEFLGLEQRVDTRQTLRFRAIIFIKSK